MLTVCLTSMADNFDAAEADALLRRIATGDRNALGTLYDQVSHGLYVYALSIVKNTHDAQDVMQDSFLAVVRGAPSYHARGKAKAWIYTIVHNRCMQLLRDRQRTAVSTEATERALNDVLILHSAEDRLLLTACLQQLSEEEQRIVVLHAVSGFRHREIAAVLDLPRSTVLSKYNRALKKLRVILEKG